MHVSTVRYYERRGLLAPDTRSSGGNYRLFRPEAAERLRFIRAAQLAGFTLNDIATLLQIEENDADCTAVRLLIEARLARVHEQIEHFERARVMLDGWLRACGRAEPTGGCVLLRDLHDDSPTRAPPESSRKIGNRP
jgi:MerR family mercuric resistance operon transcriptional regulator